MWYFVLWVIQAILCQPKAMSASQWSLVQRSSADSGYRKKTARFVLRLTGLMSQQGGSIASFPALLFLLTAVQLPSPIFSISPEYSVTSNFGLFSCSWLSSWIFQLKARSLEGTGVVNIWTKWESRTNGHIGSGETDSGEPGAERRLDWIVTEIGASDAEIGVEAIQEQASSRTKRSGLK